jgi:hypothetical protein
MSQQLIAEGLDALTRSLELPISLLNGHRRFGQPSRRRPHISSVFVQASRCCAKLLALLIGVGVILQVIAVTAVVAVFAAELDFVTLSSLPPEVRDAFEKSPHAKRYQLSAHINPFYLHGDFNGEGR